MVISIWRGDSKFEVEGTRLEDIGDETSEEISRWLFRSRGRDGVAAERRELVNAIDNDQFPSARTRTSGDFWFLYPTVSRSKYFTMTKWPPKVRKIAKPASCATHYLATAGWVPGTKTVDSVEYCTTVKTTTATRGAVTDSVLTHQLSGPLNKKVYLELHDAVVTVPPCSSFPSGERAKCARVQGNVTTVSYTHLTLPTILLV